MLVIDRRRGKVQPSHGRHLRAPHAGRVDHYLGADGAFVGDHPRHLALRPKLEAGDTRVGVNRHAQLARAACEVGGGEVGVEMPIARQVDRTVQALFGEGREVLDCFLGRGHFHLQPDGARLAYVAQQFVELRLAGCHAQAADVFDHAKLAEQIDAVLADLHQGG